MIRLSPAIRDRLGALGERDQVIASMRLDGAPCGAIASQFGVSRSTISKALNRALALQAGQHVTPRTPRPAPRKATRYGAPIDDAWFERNVALLRSYAGDDEHQHRYLRCIEYLWGEDMRERMAIAAGLSP